MATIEDISSGIIAAGVRRSLFVVPEFQVTARDYGFEKKIDVAWLRQRDDQARIGSLRRWEIVAAFEIEGYDVPLERIRIHSKQFSRLHVQEGCAFPSFVVLYNEALHRANPAWGEASPEPFIQTRVQTAIDSGNILTVIDGRSLVWLDSIASA